MRAFAFALVLVLGLFTGICSAGQYDGIWQIPGNTGSYEFIRHDDNGLIIWVSVGNDSSALYGQWFGTTIGLINGNTATSTRTESAHYSDIQFSVTFDTRDRATFTVTRCTKRPTYSDDCPPLNTPMPLQKLF